MIISPSSELIALARAQVALTTSLGASLSVVYLADELVEGGDRKFIPIVADPEMVGWEPEKWLNIPNGRTLNISQNELPAILPGSRMALKPQMPDVEARSNYYTNESKNWQEVCQIALPLLHDGVVMGVLVTAREDRAWNPQEEAQLQRIAHTLAISCFLDQRQLWWQKQLGNYRVTATQQYNTLHNLLHQFKSPITALKTFGKLLRKRLQPEDKNYTVADSIVRESDRLSTLLLQFDQTVDLGEANLSIIPHQPTISKTDEIEVLPSLLSAPILPKLLPGTALSCQIPDILKPLLISAEALCEEKQVAITADISPNLPPVTASPEALREVLSNLIDNAVKYTPNGGKVYIKVELQEKLSGIVIGISDTGPGIPPEDLAHLFERYYRGAQGQTDIPGTGLGLAIARDLIEEMQGKITAFSPTLPEWTPKAWPGTNGGTTFLVWLGLSQNKEIANLVSNHT